MLKGNRTESHSVSNCVVKSQFETDCAISSSPMTFCSKNFTDIPFTLLTDQTCLLQEAASLGKKVMVLDYVVPTPKGTTWGKTRNTQVEIVFEF